MIDYKALGLRVKELRRRKHLTQEKLAELVHLSKSHIGCIENSTSIPSLETLVQIAVVLGVTPDYLLAGTVRGMERSKRVADKLDLCSQDEQELVELFVDAILEKRHSKPNR